MIKILRNKLLKITELSLWGALRACNITSLLILFLNYGQHLKLRKIKLYRDKTTAEIYCFGPIIERFMVLICQIQEIDQKATLQDLSCKLTSLFFIFWVRSAATKVGPVPQFPYVLTNLDFFLIYLLINCSDSNTRKTFVEPSFE